MNLNIQNLILDFNDDLIKELIKKENIDLEREVNNYIKTHLECFEISNFLIFFFQFIFNIC